MLKRSDGFPVRRLMTALAIMWAMAIGLAAAGGRQQPTAAAAPVAAAAAPTGAAAAPTAPATQANGFVGDDTCSTCHEPEAKALHLTQHGKAQNTRTPAAKTNQSCETCHGPGQAHVD